MKQILSISRATSFSWQRFGALLLAVILLRQSRGLEVKYTRASWGDCCVLLGTRPKCLLATREMFGGFFPSSLAFIAPWLPRKGGKGPLSLSFARLQDGMYECHLVFPSTPEALSGEQRRRQNHKENRG